MEFTLDNGQRDLLWLVLAPAAPALCSQIGHGMPQWAIILASIISCWILLATAYTETNRLWKDSSRVRNCQHQTIIRAWTVLESSLDYLDPHYRDLYIMTTVTGDYHI
ncbi:hypothetical protein HMPREF1584_00495 [Gardnerella vaginalis JCP8481A]|uniref:Uncharacterized protein n=1 Tax=Gardnerella vaginalis TaxID=2702 RepID=A0A133NYU4_GARVA|nr:hypothetical protein HMPREF1584_00495 [Gardnerella vaginalis JCP8481A]EPI44670.1 hypothetical protein HMPREF1585_00102 [Gardnerella vaginalis JCP8481B]KXA21454.1 hypothetical protein HMPREF3208_00548 [Gardnerella vaginalis]